MAIKAEFPELLLASMQTLTMTRLLTHYLIGSKPRMRTKTLEMFQTAPTYNRSSHEGARVRLD